MKLKTYSFFRALLRTMANTLCIMALFALLACRPQEPSGAYSANPSTVIRVGKEPAHLTLLSGGSRLIASNLGENTISIVDTVSCQELARIPLPVRERDASGEPTYFHVSGISIDERHDRILAVTTGGQVFAIDLKTFAVQSLFSDSDLSFEGAVWERAGNRLILCGQHLEFGGTGILELSEKGLRSLGRPGNIGPEFCVMTMAIHGSDLQFLAGPSRIAGGAMMHTTAVGRLDLRTETLLVFRVLPEGIVMNLAVGPQGRIFVADAGENRLLSFLPGWEDAIERPLSNFWHRGELPPCPTVLDVDTSRVVLNWLGSMPNQNRVLEYSIADGSLSDLPVGEIDLSLYGQPYGLLLLPDGRLCCSFSNPGRIVFLDASDRRPFSGFYED